MGSHVLSLGVPPRHIPTMRHIQVDESWGEIWETEEVVSRSREIVQRELFLLLLDGIRIPHPQFYLIDKPLSLQYEVDVVGVVRLR